MRMVKAHNGQTLWDIAIEHLGGIETVFDLLDANDGFELDKEIPAGTSVMIPDAVVNKYVVQYFSENDLHPASGLGEETVITQDDMNNIKQDLNYDLAGGSAEFDKVKLVFLRDLLTVQIGYTDLSSEEVVISLDQSLDGINWSPVPYCSYVLDPEKDTHTFNIYGILSNFVRGHLEVPEGASGTIDYIIWKT